MFAETLNFILTKILRILLKYETENQSKERCISFEGKKIFLLRQNAHKVMLTNKPNDVKYCKMCDLIKDLSYKFNFSYDMWYMK